MAEKTDKTSKAFMEALVSLCKRRGFIFQSSEIYGGINGFWDYGPLGTELKRNVRERWWQAMTRLREDVVGLDATIIMHPKIWKASGHLDTFSDPMSTCRHCKKLVRTDQVWDMLGESAWANSIAELCPGGQTHSAKLLGWAKGKGHKLAPNLALVRNPEVTLSWLSERVEKPESAPLSTKELYQYLATEQFNQTGLITPCPHCGGELTEPRPFNLMFKTIVGPVEDQENVAYLRPETAQAIFVQFKNIHDTSRQQVPFGICQIGKAFRNEVTPRNYTFRSREFEQMELEFFIRPDEALELIYGKVTSLANAPDLSDPQPAWGWEVWHKYWVEQRLAWYRSIGLPDSSLVQYWQEPAELAHYARACVDIQFAFPFGTQELEGIAARSDFDLTQHQLHSGKSMEVFDDELKTAAAKLDDAARASFVTDVIASWRDVNKSEADARAFCEKLFEGRYVPHVIEPSAGVDRLVLALLCNAFSEDKAPDDKGKEEIRTVMRFAPKIAPIKVAVFPLLKNKPELVAKSRAVFEMLRRHWPAFYDESGAIGRRYRRQDEAGTPYGITVDFPTLEDDTVTLRDRDTMAQQRVKVAELEDKLATALL
ncbi:MAG: glycine--tRNA ligase [bacterium]